MNSLTSQVIKSFEGWDVLDTANLIFYKATLFNGETYPSVAFVESEGRLACYNENSEVVKTYKLTLTATCDNP